MSPHQNRQNRQWSRWARCQSCFSRANVCCHCGWQETTRTAKTVKTAKSVKRYTPPRPHPPFAAFRIGPATSQNLVVKFDGEICGGVLVENASDDFTSKRSSKISFQTSPEFSGLPFCGAFVVMNFHSESVDFVNDFSREFFLWISWSLPSL